MSRIKGRDTKPELLVRKYLHMRGFRYRLHGNLPGKPDLVLQKYKAVIFINGCFWHRHEGCKNFVLPQTRTDFWKEKIDGNVKRDQLNYDKLLKMGFNPIIAWECEIEKKFDATIARLLQQLNYEYR